MNIPNQPATDSGTDPGTDPETDKAPVVVLISGSGSNLQALIDAHGDDYPARVVAVISNVDGVRGLERARQADIPTHVIDHRDYPDRDSFDQAVMQVIDSYQPGLVLLAGFMRILTDGFVEHYAGRLLNIHPSLLPRYKGLHTHQQALDNGDTHHGATVHYVTAELDGGPLILQARVAVMPDDDADSLAARVLSKEHIIYPTVVDWAASGRLRMHGGLAELDGDPLQHPVLLENL